MSNDQNGNEEFSSTPNDSEKEFAMRSVRLSLTAIVIFIGVLVISPRSEAGHGYFAFSEFCVSGEFTKVGLKEGDFVLDGFNIIVECACVNVQSSSGWQPGTGNTSAIPGLFDVKVLVDKDRGVVELSACSDILGVYNNHDCTDPGCLHEFPPPDGFHICHAGSEQKEELDHSCVFTEFESAWRITDQNGKVKYSGVDTCEWNGGRNEDGTLNTTGKKCGCCVDNPDPALECPVDFVCPFECTFTCTGSEGK